MAAGDGRWRMNRCSCCCLNMHCGYDEDGLPILPERLSFIASVAGSCPGADPDVVSDEVSMYGEDWGEAGGCLDCTPGRCDDTVEVGEDPCDQRFMATCGCYFAWYRQDADAPLCGPYISSVILQCFRSDRHPFPNCTHLRREGCLWYVQVNVARALPLIPRAHGCETTISLDPPFGCISKKCWIQNPANCLWEFLEVGCDGPPADRCAPDCPPCYDCPSHNVIRCAAGEECCGEDGCQFCECPTDPPCTGDCAECSHCIEEPPGGAGLDPDPSCLVPCPGFRNIRYHYWLSGDNDCTGGGNNDIKGCNPTSCGTTDDDTGNFYLRVGCNENDFVEFSCSSVAPSGLRGTPEYDVRVTVDGDYRIPV